MILWKIAEKNDQLDYYKNLLIPEAKAIDEVFINKIRNDSKNKYH